MKEALLITQIAVSTTIVVFILIQSKGTGFGRSLTGASFTRRGLEQIVFKLSFVLVIAFIIISVSLLFV